MHISCYIDIILYIYIYIIAEPQRQQEQHGECHEEEQVARVPDPEHPRQVDERGPAIQYGQFS